MTRIQLDSSYPVSDDDLIKGIELVGNFVNFLVTQPEAEEVFMPESGPPKKNIDSFSVFIHKCSFNLLKQVPSLKHKLGDLW
jgi:hypothetical protein